MLNLSQIAVLLATMLLKTPQIAVFFDSQFKNTVNSGVLGYGKLKNIVICSGFCLTEHKNTVKYGTYLPFWQRQPQKPRYSPFLLGNCFMAAQADLAAERREYSMPSANT